MRTTVSQPASASSPASQKSIAAAQSTRTSSFPHRASQASATLRASPSSAGSAAYAVPISQAASSVRATASTSAPSAASRAAHARPTLEPTPTTTALRPASLGNPHERLSERVAAHHPRERFRRVLEPVHDRLLPLEPPSLQPVAQLALRLEEPVGIAAATEAAQRQVLRRREEEVPRAALRLRRVVLGDRAAQRDAAPAPQHRQRCREMVAADIVEVEVD